MGYCIRQGKTSFRIPKDKLEQALGLLKAYVEDLEAHRAHVHYQGSYREVLSEQHFKEAMREFGWDAMFDVNGDCTRVYYELEKRDNEEEILRRIAPVVDDRSTIEFRGEDGAGWKYTFLNGKLFRQDRVDAWSDPVEVVP